MACRIEEDPKRRPWLVLMLRSSEFEHSSLGDIEVLDGDVQVHLLRCDRARPHRRGETFDLLEPDRIAILGSDVSPVLLDLDGPVEQRPVERGQRRWIGTVDDDGWISRDGHEANLDLRSDIDTSPDAALSCRPLNGTQPVPRLGRRPAGEQTSLLPRRCWLQTSRAWHCDYEARLNRYDDPNSPLSRRLAQVQAWLRSELDERGGNVSGVSACAGDGRETIDVLAARDDTDRVCAVLLESHPGVADHARARAARSHLNGVTVRTCDAADTTNYVDAVPAS